MTIKEIQELIENYHKSKDRVERLQSEVERITNIFAESTGTPVLSLTFDNVRFATDSLTLGDMLDIYNGMIEKEKAKFDLYETRLRELGFV